MQKRVLIVDFNHMAHSQFFSPYRLSIMVDGQSKDTTIQTNTIKNIFRWSKMGVFPTAVCFDRPVAPRKMFLQEQFKDMQIGSEGEYKGNRSRMPDAMFEGISDTENMLRMAGVSVHSKQGYEADDLIYACVKRAKELYPEYPIDVVTNDADLLPLVDDVVSVFLRSKKGTYSTDPAIEKAKYVQVTPENYQSVVESLSDYKGFTIPYNTLLLHKLLRGDKSDNYRRKDISSKFSPNKWNAFIERMQQDDINFADIFRYGEPIVKLIYKDTREPYEGTLQDALADPNKSNITKKICNTEELDVILEVLEEYTDMTPEMLDHVEKLYWGINLNQIYPNKDPQYSRKAYVVGENGTPDILPYDEVELRKVVKSLQINLPVNV